jgi:hypothetical protein
VTRRTLGRGRLLIALGAVVAVIGALPPWWTVGGTVTPQATGNGFEGSGIIVFVAAVAMLALIVLPFASRAGESRLDRPLSYTLLGGMAIGAFLLRVYEIYGEERLGLPDRALGLWLTGGGMALVAWGVAELLAERPAWE